MKTDQEWADFGKLIYDTAMNIFADKPVNSVTVPFKLDDGALCRVKIEGAAVFIERVGDEWKHYYRMSDGSYRERT